MLRNPSYGPSDDPSGRHRIGEGPAVTAPSAESRASGLVALGRALDTAAPASGVLDVLAVGEGTKPLAGVTLCYTADGHPAWDEVDDSAGALRRDDLGDRLTSLGFEWRLTPVRTATEDRRYTWYDLMVARTGSDGVTYLERAPADPAARQHRAYGRALGYPESAVDWFTRPVSEGGRSAFDILQLNGMDPLSVVHAASVTYVPAPTLDGVDDAVADGRALTAALGRLADAAAERPYVLDLLTERVEETLARYDIALPGRPVADVALD